jgi:streptogrisin D
MPCLVRSPAASATPYASTGSPAGSPPRPPPSPPGARGIQNKAQTLKCSIGFNVHNSAGDKLLVTAGHCGNEVSTWYKAADGTSLGTNLESSFPGNDYAVVTYRNSDVSAYGTVWVDGAEQ